MKTAFKFLVFSILMLTNFSIDAKEYKGAEYRTKEAFLYGRFEVNLKTSFIEGMLSSFFTYNDAGGGWNEIDIEILGRYTNDFQMNPITPGQVNHVGHYLMSSSPHADFHTYAFEWTPEYVSWFVDGVEVLRQTGAHIQTLNLPQKIMMNVWIPQYENWVGIFSPDVLPSFSYYDWVSYYSYTPGTGSYGSGNNFSHGWTDEFTEWDTTRWDKATHTFTGNDCDFIQENAVFNDGKLVLCLTNSTNIGYVDVKAPTILWARGTEGKVEVMFSEEVEEVSAETIQNYLIPDVTINSIELQSDLKTVILSVTGLNLNIPKNVIALSIKDRSPVPNIMGGTLKTIFMVPNPLTFPLKINCGGDSVLDFSSDQNWYYQTEYGYMDGDESAFVGQPFGGTDEDEVYQTEKYGMVTYRTRVPNGLYKVKLMFAENYFTSSGNRIFDVSIEQNKVLTNLDIYSLVGKNNAYEAEFDGINIQDGILDIYFAAKVNNAVISGIVITPDPNSVNENPDINKMDFRLEQNYPNPFNGMTKIDYSLSMPDNVSLQVYDILGEQIIFKDLGFHEAGSYSYLLDSKKYHQLNLHQVCIFIFLKLKQKRDS
ncbi:MAG: family 16 glycosylhydrolase [Ignavibacteriales bacterium]|nr:family 16 glycosylhydrolase [Ignavibacteriales bacterium]